ncbi:phosphatase 2C family protein [Penicillium chrysogenum]|uniref:phosphatase 2C family protein n=1 Tax=Penicillium chrysogenum TaxID=5076 RepID=UPI0024DF0A88|nr:phosphatase 2C family protein [Penicillium chrysogenum]KAJ5244650.1 phosphatase 2C family protein [Penicillium chrysogenum]
MEYTDTKYTGTTKIGSVVACSTIASVSHTSTMSYPGIICYHETLDPGFALMVVIGTLRKFTVHVEFSNLLGGSGGASAKGSRPSQQDQFAIVLSDHIPVQISDTLALFAVYDGHGSKRVAQHANRHLKRFLFESPAFQAGRYEDAVREAISKEESSLLESFRNGDHEFAVSGSTVSLAIVNLTKGILLHLTKSHKPSDPPERDRIERAGGSVNYESGTARLGALNMSRALGDLQYKNPLDNVGAGPVTRGQERAAITPAREQGDLLSSEPSLFRMCLKEDHRYILALTTDGVTNVLEDHVIIDEIMRRHGSGSDVQEIADALVRDVTCGSAKDNATCIVVLLDGCLF